MLRNTFTGVALSILLGLLPNTVLADQILSTSGFTTCDDNSTVTVQNLDITYNNNNKTVTFNVAGTSTKVQNVTAVLNVTAYGISVYSNSFNPCSTSTFVSQLCPVPEGSFSASGTQDIPESYASMIPSIAFQVPDIDAEATMELKSLDTDEDVACIQSKVSNGKTVSLPAVSYVAASIAGAALVASGISAALGSTSSGGAGTTSPSFSEVLGWFQGVAMNGMLSVNYPDVYREFSTNFGFATGLIPWTSMQQSIDNFRSATGGNLTEDSVQYLENATLVFSDSTSSKTRRSVALWVSSLLERDLTTSVGDSNSTTLANSTSAAELEVVVAGIKAYAEELSVPEANTFMTVLLVVAIVIAAIAVGILLFKVILEAWALFASFPKKLTGFRKRYWAIMGRTIVQLILAMYGIWVLYCIFQFTQGDSWAAKLLAGVTLALFTGVLAYFTYVISKKAREFKQVEGDTSSLYLDKEVWIRYNIFYESFKSDYWWIFIPAIIYMFAKGCIIAAADGKGMVQTVGQLVVEGVMLVLLLWSRPYERRSSNLINIFIQIVRVLSVICILVFVEELGISQTTQTIAGVVLIAIQSALTAALAILIGINVITGLCKENPHRRKRKLAEKMRDDNLTPLEARNSLLKDPALMASSSSFTDTKPLMRNDQDSLYQSGNTYDMRKTPTPELADPLHNRVPSRGQTPTIPNLGPSPGQYDVFSNDSYRGYR